MAENCHCVDLTLNQWLMDVFAFNTARAIHTNLLVAWMLLGFMGGAYFILPMECDRELFSTKIAWVLLILFAVTAITAVVGFLFRHRSDHTPPRQSITPDHDPLRPRPDMSP